MPKLKIRGHVCAYYEGAGRIKPNEGCPTCPFYLKDNCTDNGVILHIGTFLEHQRGTRVFGALRAAFTRLIERYGSDSVAWVGAETGLWTISNSTIQSESVDRALVSIGQIIEKRKGQSIKRRRHANPIDAELLTTIEKMISYNCEEEGLSAGFDPPQIRYYCIHCEGSKREHEEDCPVPKVERWLDEMRGQTKLELKRETTDEGVVKGQVSSEVKSEVSLDAFGKEEKGGA